VWQAHDILALPDVTVTSLKDKEAQLPKLRKLNERVMSFASILPAADFSNQPQLTPRAGLPSQPMSQRAPLGEAESLFACRVGEVNLHGNAEGRALAYLFPPTLEVPTLSSALSPVAAQHAALGHNKPVAVRSLRKAREIAGTHAELSVDEAAAITMYTDEVRCCP